MSRPTADPEWEEYVEALQAFTEAPRRAAAKRARIAQDAARAARGAEEALRAAVELRNQLERRVREVGQLFHKVRVEQQVPDHGPATPATIGEPATVRAALTTLDELEQALRAEADRLDATRRSTPPPPPARPIWPVGLGAAVLAFGLMIAIIVVLSTF